MSQLRRHLKAGPREPGGARGVIAPPPNFLSGGDEYACAPPPKFWQSLGIYQHVCPPPQEKIVPAPLSQGSVGQEVSVTREIFDAGDRYCELPLLLWTHFT